MLIRVESNDNSRLKLVRKLQTRKGRSSEGKFVAEGINLVREIIARRLPTDFVIVADDFLDSLDDDFGYQFSGSPENQVYAVPANIFNKLTDADYGVGILAVVDMMPDEASVIDEIPQSSNVLILDRIQDPGNMGTMIRTAVAAGYAMILAVKGTADIYSPKVLRATAGMIFDMPIAYVQDGTEAAGLVRASGRKLVVTDPSGGKPYYEENLRTGIALVIGNEGNGISEELMSLADVRVTLPMKGRIESLNAAVSASILMYEAVRG